MQLCTACRRHVKAAPCPFCGCADANAVTYVTGSGWSRAQILAGVALASAVAAGCTETPAPTPGGSSSGQPESMPQTIYGAPPAALDAAPVVPPPVGSSPLDAGNPDAGNPDAGKSRVHASERPMPPAPVYGAAPSSH